MLDTFDAELEYWRARLAGAPPALQLPADRPRAAARSYEGAVVSSELAQPLTGAVEALGKRTGCTPFVTHLAAFATLLHRYTGETDLCVGTAAGPNNSVALRCDLSGDPPFVDVLERVQSTALGAFANRRVPFERVAESVAAVRDPAVHALYSVAFNLHDDPAPNLTDPPGSATATSRSGDLAANVDLEVVGTLHPGGLTLRWEYNRGIFDHETIAALAGHYRRLLEAVAGEPERRISRLPLMSEAERRAVLAMRGKRAPYERDASIDQLFARQAARTPDAVALEDERASLTYAELDARANRLAGHLRALGVATETPVAIALERGVALPVAVLAILKAGGAYVPLDPSYPRERLAFMLQDSGARHIVTERALRDRLPVDGARVVSLDEDAAAIAAAPSAAPISANGPDSLAYVMYTSGSTGTPKGVAVVHRGVVRLVRGSDFSEIAPDDVFLQLGPLGFDASTFELWAPLLNGARLALAPPGPRGFSELGPALERHRVTTLVLTPALFHQMIDLKLEALAGVRRLIAGGDVVSPDHARRFLERFPHAQLVNAYGPTENTTVSTCYNVPSAEGIGPNLPIGRPIANSTACVLDARRQPQPFGVPGELYVGGDGLARGYLNAPQLTAERFVPDPFDDDPSARLYRTGDRVRLRRDGNLEFLGRLDAQVKIRGFRIEPGEIEAVLRAHPNVLEAAVTTVEERGDRALAAYVQPAPGEPPGEPELRAYLRAKLPEHMVPGRIAILAVLPAHPSGKLDRKALPPIAAPAAPAAGDGRPQSPTETILAGLLGELLGRTAIRRDDDIFALGAHSLLAMRIVARIAQRFGVELVLRDLFDHPTIAQLAAKLDAAPRTPDAPGVARASGRGAPTLEALVERLGKRR